MSHTYAPPHKQIENIKSNRFNSKRTNYEHKWNGVHFFCIAHKRSAHTCRLVSDALWIYIVVLWVFFLLFVVFRLLPATSTHVSIDSTSIGRRKPSMRQSFNQCEGLGHFCKRRNHILLISDFVHLLFRMISKWDAQNLKFKPCQKELGFLLDIS